MSSIVFVDLQPREAVGRARELVAAGQSEALEALDLHLRWHLVNYIQNRDEDVDGLLAALLEACHWVKREGRGPWNLLWPYLLELLEGAKAQPSLAEGLEAVEGRAAEVLGLLVQHGKPLRPTEISDKLKLSIQQVSNLGQKLEAAGLIVRRRSGGKATWIFPTARGTSLVKKLPPINRSKKQVAFRRLGRAIQKTRDIASR